MLQGSRSYTEYWRYLRREVKYDLLEFLKLLKTPHEELRATYDRVARRYDAGDFLWKEWFARSAWQYFQSLIKELIPKKGVVLDAGAGTGESTRAVLRLAQPRRVIGVDISAAMLYLAREKLQDARVVFQQADMTALPFPDNTFDAVVSAWAIETLADPKTAVREFLRVIKYNGYVIYVFSSLPKFGVARLYSFMLEKLLGKTFDWRFLPRSERPYHCCRHSSLVTFGKGLLTVVVLRKCCTVEDEIAPCLLSETWEREFD